MSKIKTTNVLKPVAWGLFWRNDRYEQVKITHVIQEDGVFKNRIECPDGTVLEVAHLQLVFDGRIKNFEHHPEGPKTAFGD